MTNKYIQTMSTKPSYRLVLTYYKQYKNSGEKIVNTATAIGRQ